MCHLGPTRIKFPSCSCAEKTTGPFCAGRPMGFCRNETLAHLGVSGRKGVRCRKVVYKKKPWKNRNFPKWFKSPKGWRSDPIWFWHPKNCFQNLGPERRGEDRFFHLLFFQRNVGATFFLCIEASLDDSEKFRWLSLKPNSLLVFTFAQEFLGAKLVGVSIDGRRQLGNSSCIETFVWGLFGRSIPSAADQAVAEKP